MKGMVVIDREICKGCAYCVDVCPKKVIIIEDVFNQKGFFPASARFNAKCTGCCLCAHMCPEVAIEVYREK
jgi:2-oxoglutarate ferredoxin oxidoreductase subunit delta